MSIPSIAISVHRLPICKNCGNSSAKSAMSTSVCFKARSFCAHSRRLEIVSGIICSCVKPFQVATARTHTRHRPDFLLHRSTEDWDISKCYNMSYADLFAFVRPSTAINVIFEVHRRYYIWCFRREDFRSASTRLLWRSARPVMPSYSQRTPPLDGKIGKLDTVCVQSGPLFFLLHQLCAVCHLSLWGDVGSRRLGSLGILQAPGYWRRQPPIKLISMVSNDKGR